MYIDIDKIRNGEKVEGRSLVPKEFLDYKDYLIDEDSAFNLIFSKALKLIKCNKIYSGDEIDDLPKKVAYRKNGFLYVYELREKPLYKLYGTDFYGDYGIFESTGDREYADKFKRYSYVKVYSTEPEVKIGIADFSGSKNILGKNGTQFASKTTWKNGKTERIDVENPSPGKRAGQIHYHEPNNTKWYLDIEEKQFYNPQTGELAPKKIQKLLRDKDVIDAINKALKFLGEGKLK